jgi:hypothetical protein
MTLFIVKNEISPRFLLRVSKPDSHKNRNEIIISPRSGVESKVSRFFRFHSDVDLINRIPSER